ncbi:DNA polymerase I [bacterium]|nr:DNA polymerase I [bacterium]
MEKKKLFLLDAFALIYRAYFAFSKNPRINSKGLNTSAIMGFANTLMEVLEKQKPDYISVVFDSSGPTFRHEMFSEYKAHREEMPEDIRKAVPIIKQLIDEFNIHRCEISGYEADDIVGTLAHQAVADDLEVYMMTPDKDYAQLVKEGVYMFRPGRGGNGPETWGVEEVKEKFEIEDCLQVIDILGLWGDASDNIPGVPGVGEKTAKKLIAKYGSIEGLYENTADLKGKQKEKVEANKEQAFLSKELVTIALDCPIQFEREDFLFRENKGESLKALLVDLEFRRLTTKLFPGGAPVAVEGEQASLFGTEEVEVVEEQKSFDKSKVDYTLIQSITSLKKVLAEVSKADAICFDTETTGLDALKAKMIGLALSTEKGKAFYIDCQQERESVLEELKSFFQQDKLWIAQNIKYDMHVLENDGITLEGRKFDTMLAHYLIEPDQKHGMDFLALKYLNYIPVSIETLIGKKGKGQKSMLDVPVEEVTDYACEDADITFQLYELFKVELEKTGRLYQVFEEIEMPLVDVLKDMERVGFNLDVDSLKVMSEELAKEEIMLEAKIKDLAGEEFNVSSPKQLGEVLFEKMELDAKAKKTKSGQYSTSEEVLTKLAGKHEIIDHILDFRGVKKLKSTYVDALPLLIDENSNRIHTSFNQAVAATGRLSSVNPNLQNIPIRTERGKLMRKAFIPSEGNMLLAADYSQVELRLMAEMSGDEGMIEAFQNKQDIHSATAAKVFGISLEKVDRDQRSKAKMVNFGIIYGISAFGLSQRLGVSRKEAKAMIDEYFAKYPKVKEFMDKSVKDARDHGFVETIKGRRRVLNDINSRNAVVRGFAERNAINAPIQGAAADIIKIAMINIQDRMKAEDLKSKMLLQVHDELIFDVLPSELDKMKDLVKTEMEGAVSMSVPLEVEASLGENWLQAH